MKKPAEEDSAEGHEAPGSAGHGAASSEPDRAALGAFGFDLPEEEWLDRVRESEQHQTLGNIGPYELIEEVSRGGQGVVFRARQPGTGREIALKRLLAGSFATASMRRRFEREIEAAAALNHPNIVTVYGMEVVEGNPVFAMEWIEGVSVTSWVGGTPEAVPTRDPEETLGVFLRIADAVQHAHSRGVLHRDLKPSNVLVDATGQPHVLDFGLAKRFAEDGEGSATLTGSADFLGTPAYASPEQFHTDELVLDTRSDVYSLGVLLFELLTGRSPYGETRNLSELIARVESHEPPAASRVDPRLGYEVDTIVRKAMAKDRDQRYASVGALAADLRRYLAGEPVLALDPSSWYLVRKLARKHRIAVSFAALALACVAALALLAGRQALQLRDERNEAVRARELAYEQKELAVEAAASLERMLLEWTATSGPPPLFGLSTVRMRVVLPECLEERQATVNENFVPLPPKDSPLRAPELNAP